MTDDKHFKHLVRDEARRTGRRYTEVRDELRPPLPPEAIAVLRPAEVRDRFRAIVDAVGTWIYGADALVEAVALALITPGSVLLRGGPGNGMTALGQGVAAAIGGELLSIDGRAGLGDDGPLTWTSDDVVVISHFDGLAPADQVAVIEARMQPAIVLAKRHPVAERMPHPPDDEMRERFLFGAELLAPDVATSLRIVSAVQDRSTAALTPAHRDAVDGAGLRAMRAAVDAVDVPEDVRRFIVEQAAATRTESSLLLGVSTVATLDLLRATAARAVADGRGVADVGDAQRVVQLVFAHRVVPKDPAVRPG
jgi:MoxR-like ATPase